MNYTLINFNLYEDAPWRNMAAIEMRGTFDNFFCQHEKMLLVCLTVNIPGLCPSKAAAPLTRALKSFRGELIRCGVGINFALFKLPRMEGEERGGRFRVLLYADNTVIRSGQMLHEGFCKVLDDELSLSGEFSQVTLNVPPIPGDFGIVINGENFQTAMDWCYHYLQDSEYIKFGKSRTLMHGPKKPKEFYEKIKRSPRSRISA